MSETASSARKITLTETGEILGVPEGGAGAEAQRRFALLIFCDTESQLKPVEGGKPVVVGREAPSEVVVDDVSVSRQHARFRLNDGEVWVEDLGSRNGTFLRGRRIERERLGVGDEISVGKARVVLAGTRVSAGQGTESFAADDADYVVRNARMKKLYQDATKAAKVSVPVLILGETGSGKDHVASAIHREGLRAQKPFVVVNCAAIPAALVESTLFGHERGSFTGADTRAIGVFERAHEGVLFLDEIGELGSGAQAAILRAIETRRISRVGGSSEIPVDVRIVAATHCDLGAMVEEGTFRQDLYFRLSGVQLDVPPLRARLDEIDALALLFLAKARKEWGVRPREIDANALNLLRLYAWPGNVRQLRHAIERAALLGSGEAIAVTDLPDYIVSGTNAQQIPVAELGLKELVQRYERTLIDDALRRAGGSRQLAAKLLRIPLRTLFRKMRSFDSDTPNASDA
jgi:two-component system, NtrC family, response regulator AtoC